MDCLNPNCLNGTATASADLAGMFWAEGDAIDVVVYDCPLCHPQPEPISPPNGIAPMRGRRWEFGGDDA